MLESAYDKAPQCYHQGAFSHCLDYQILARRLKVKTRYNSGNIGW